MQKNKITMNNESATITLKDAFAKFKRSKMADNISPKTIKTYETHYNCFDDFYGGAKAVSKISDDTIEDFKEHLKKSGTKNPQTVQSYIGSIRAFLYYCMKKGLLEKFEIRKPKGEKKEKEPYDDDELRALLQKPITENFVEYRTWVYINFIYGTGCRINTALNVKIKDIDFNQGQVKFKVTKSKADKTIPLPTTLNDVLIDYLKIRKGDPNDYLFCTGGGDQLSLKAMQQALKKYNNERGIDKTSSHLFRHAFARDWLRHNTNVYLLQDIMQHQSITTTRGYVHQYKTDMHEAFNINNPLDDMYKTMTVKVVPKKKVRIKMTE
jgi:integrase/recombinase XerD